MDEGFKHDESARKLVQNDLAAMKEEIRQKKLESGSTVCSEASIVVETGARGTFARLPPSIAAEMEFKGRITDYTRSSFQGLTMDEVAAFVVDLKKNDFIERSKVCRLGTDKKTEQGKWPTQRSACGSKVRRILLQ